MNSPQNATPYPSSERSQVKRLPERGSSDRATIEAILDEGLICHVGFVQDGEPFVIPTIYARDGDVLFLHGSPASRMLRQLARGVPVCVTVTHLDGLILARSAFHHSMNYRSVVLFGTARLIKDPQEKLRALEAVVEHVVPGRSRDARPPNDFELKYTQVLALKIDEATAKVRTGGPKDDAEDMALPVWAGEIPLRLSTQPPIQDAECRQPTPDYVTGYRRPSAG